MASKSKLNELVQKRALGLPVYITNSKEGGYSCDLTIGKQKFKSEQVHSKKKAAEDDVAAVAFRHLAAENGEVSSTTSKPVLTQAYPKPVLREATTAAQNKMIKEPSPVDHGDKPSQQLQDYCGSQGWTEPIYNLKTVNDKATCTILVHRKMYSYDDTYSSGEAAKQETAKRVLNELTGSTTDNTTISSFPSAKQSHPASAQLVNDVEKMTINNSSDQESPSNGGSLSPVDDKPRVSDKNMLQHLCHKKGLPPPEYTTEYPPGMVGYISEVSVGGKPYRSSVQGSKKVAEAAAAREAIKYLTSLDSATEKAVSPVPLKISGKPYKCCDTTGTSNLTL